jgi:hypothetical protein
VATTASTVTRAHVPRSDRRLFIIVLQRPTAGVE